MSRALENAEIDCIIDKYANAAARAKTAGFDMVELHGGTGYLLAQFLSPRTNQRTDKYGGILENRQLFALEVLTRVKEVADDFPVGYRFLSAYSSEIGNGTAADRATDGNVSIALLAIKF